MKFLKLKLVAASLATMMVFNGCSGKIDLGHGHEVDLDEMNAGWEQVKKGSGDFTKEDDEAYGRSVAYSVTSTYKVDKNDRLLWYINCIGFTLVKCGPAPGDHYLFGVLDSDKVGAFSGANGYVFITRGAISNAQDEAEVAGILAHELTHLYKRHGMKAVGGEMQKQGLMTMFTAATSLEAAGNWVDTMVNVVEAKGFDQPQEYEADEGAIDLLIAAGYDPHSFLNFVRRLDAYNASSKNNGIMNMSTHPGAHERGLRIAEILTKKGEPHGATLGSRLVQFSELPPSKPKISAE